MITVELLLLLPVGLLLLSLSSTAAFAVPKHYRKQPELERFLTILNIKHPDRTYLYSIGKSVAGTNLNVIAIAARDPDRHIRGRPEVKYVANIHGDEAVGRELLLIFAEYLLVNPERDPRVTHLLNTTRVHLLPSMNPDGFDVSNEGVCDGDYTDKDYGRTNKWDVDLNRDFPDFFDPTVEDRQPETIAVMRWLEAIPFVLSGSFHGGALVVNYPFDNTADGNRKYSLSPDDDVFRKLSHTYVRHHAKLSNNQFCVDSPTFPGGITNGADWYPVKGGMQDYNYIRTGTLELTLEVACCKFPIASELPSFWAMNRESMLQLLMQVNTGVRGFIKREGDIPVASRLQIRGRNIGFNTTSLGEYWRILLPGDYVLLVESSLYPKVEVSFTVHHHRPTICNVTLSSDIEGLIDCDSPEDTKSFQHDDKPVIKESTVKSPLTSTTPSSQTTTTPAGSEYFTTASVPETTRKLITSTSKATQLTTTADKPLMHIYKVNNSAYSTNPHWLMIGAALFYPLLILISCVH